MNETKTFAALAMAGLGLIATARAWPIDYCDTEVRTVTPGATSATGIAYPSDAIVLFDGKDLSEWKSGHNGPAEWDVRDGAAIIRKGSGDIETRRSFEDIQLHIEWRIPKNISGEGQRRGNSGVFLQGRYEVQILDSYHNRTYANGQAGAVYGQVPPLVNAMRPPGDWNVFDILFTAPRFNEDGTLFTPARLTVLHNGVLIQNNAEILGGTGAWGRPGYYEPHGSGPIRLQDHPGQGDPISYRNIWVRELNTSARAGASATTTRGTNHRLEIVGTRTIRELVDDPAAREVLSRCIPELVPSPAILDYVGPKTLQQLKGELDVTLTDERLRLIDDELARALGEERR